MSRISVTLISVMILITASQASAADWAPVKTMEDIEMFMDKDSVDYPAFQIARVWRKYEFGEPMDQQGKEISTLYVYSEENCIGNRFRIFEEISIYTDDTISIESYPDPQWEIIERESFNYVLHEQVCR